MTTRIGIICANRNDGIAAKQMMPPLEGESSVILIQMHNLSSARGLTLDFLIWTEQAKMHPRAAEAEEVTAPCLSAGQR